MQLHESGKESKTNKIILGVIKMSGKVIIHESVILNLEFEYAKELLSNSGLSVTRIALDAGFGSARSFFREFRRAFHVSPGEYRHDDTIPEPEEFPHRS